MPVLGDVSGGSESDSPVPVAIEKSGIPSAKPECEPEETLTVDDIEAPNDRDLSGPVRISVDLGG
jgi:hypothetical protein